MATFICKSETHPAACGGVQVQENVRYWHGQKPDAILHVSGAGGLTTAINVAEGKN